MPRPARRVLLHGRATSLERDPQKIALSKMGSRGASPVDPIIQRATTATGCMRFFATYSPIL
jgi:hypothetical protein